jgi:uncharacterized membrane protein
MTASDSARQPPQFGAAEIGALAHLYRGEMYRSKVWRTRLDATTNWAVVTTGIALSITFASPGASVLPIVLVSLLVGVFLILEGRRYRFFDIWRTRVRVMETSFFGPLLRGEGVRVDSHWNEILADDYADVHFHIGYLEAIGRRFRRNYAWIFAVQVVSFWGKVAIHPTPLVSFDQLWERTAVGPLPGYLVLAAGTVFYAGLVALGVLTLATQRAVGRAHRVTDVEDRIQMFAASSERELPDRRRGRDLASDDPTR